MRLDEQVVRRMAIGAVFRENEKPINAMCYSNDGELLVTSSDDESIRTYRAVDGNSDKTIRTKKYGVSCARFTHTQTCVITASQNEHDHSLRYLSLHDNSYLRYFKGHRAPVTDIAMSPISDVFLSAARDSTVRYWDLRTNVCQGVLRIPPSPSNPAPPRCAVAFDPLGLIFVCGSPGLIKLFDVRNFDRGPFDSFPVDLRDPNITSVSFSPDGKQILVSTQSGELLLLDAFEGKVMFSLLANWRPTCPSATYFRPCFTPDAQFVLAGSESGAISVWNAKLGDLVCRFAGHSQPTPCVAWNPKFCSFASACSSLALWCLPQ